jgi:hypothetical protein
VEKGQWEDLDYSTESKSSETQQLTLLQQQKNGLQKFQMKSCQPFKR